MNTPLILMTAVAIIAILGWLMARSDVERWQRRYRRSEADRVKLMHIHIKCLCELHIRQAVDRRRKQQRLAALDKANAANRAKRGMVVSARGIIYP